MDINHATPASKVSDEDKAAFVMSFVKQSSDHREELVDTWDETLANYFVRPYVDAARFNQTDYPLTRQIHDRSRLGYAVLKDPESHQIVETLLAKLWNALFGADDFIQARGSGMEDAYKADTVERLLKYNLNIPGHSRSFYEWLKDALIFGTGIMEISWFYEEGVRQFRSIEVDEFTGEEYNSVQSLVVPLHDDPRIKPVNIMDFYPDPGESRLLWMRGCAKRFTIGAKEALRNKLWDREAVLRAVSNTASNKDGGYQTDHDWQEQIKYTSEADIPDDFEPLIGYNYWGEVPWDTGGDFNDRQVISVLSGEVVEDKEWPLASRRLPFFDLTINPVSGRFYGLGPLEVVKYDQDFTDTLKRMIANAVVRGTLAQPVVSDTAGVDRAKLRRFSPDVPITVQGDPRGAISYLDYKPPIEGAQSMFMGEKTFMQQASGALGAIQGHGLGTNRKSATEAAGTFQQAFDRPEMIASLIEKDSLPPIGEHLFALDQQFLETSEDLARRIGERPGSVAIADILTDFEIQFVGSRKEHNKASRLQNLERFAATVGSIPPIAVHIPWDQWNIEYMDALDLQKLRQLVGAPDTISRNIQMMMLLGQNAQNGNGTPSQGSQAMNPAQAAGGMLGTGG